MQNFQFILATDLDGTFLGGEDEDRRKLYDWIEVNRETVGLIFVSGRDLPFIGDLCSGQTKHGLVPWPDYVIGDVGTTIAKVGGAGADGRRSITPNADLEQHIADLWQDSNAEIAALLDGAAGLTLQDTPFRHRMSYHYDPDAYDPSAEEKVRAKGLDVLISDNRFFDVLPPGVSKGPSLLRLIDHLDVDRGRVLVAGDTLNDFSLFATGLKGVAVGNSEAPLIARLDQEPAASENTHRPDGHGAAGIMQAIEHHQFFSGSGVF